MLPEKSSRGRAGKISQRAAATEPVPSRSFVFLALSHILRTSHSTLFLSYVLVINKCECMYKCICVWFLFGGLLLSLPPSIYVCIYIYMYYYHCYYTLFPSSSSGTMMCKREQKYLRPKKKKNIYLYTFCAKCKNFT